MSVEKEIISIPVYGITQAALDLKREKIMKKWKTEHPGLPEEHYLTLISFDEGLVWKYNHIVGYITILISKNDVIFELYLYKKPSERYVPLSTRKKFIAFMPTVGLHFFFKRNDTNQAVIDRIWEYLRMIEKDFIPKKYNVDYTAFENVVAYIDFLKIKQDLEDAENG